MGRGTARNM